MWLLFRTDKLLWYEVPYLENSQKHQESVKYKAFLLEKHIRSLKGMESNAFLTYNFRPKLKG